MNRICQRWGRRVFLLSAIAACGPAAAGVIQGAGSAPTAKQPGGTEAVVRVQMVERQPGHLLAVPED